VLFAQLDGFDVQAEKLAAAESASNQHGEDRVVPFATERIAIRTRQEPPALLRCEPVPNTDSNPAHSFGSPDPGRKFRTQKAGIDGLISDPSDSCEAQIDRGRRVLLLFEMDSVSQDDCAIECEARL
jgi:hypothetical protein